MNIPLNQFLHGNALTKLRELPDQCVHTIITSPPYWGLRDYGTGTWVGGDPACKHYIANQVEQTVRANNTPLPLREEMGETETPTVPSGIRPGEDNYTCKKCGAKKIDEQLGLEKTPEEYVANMVSIFHECKRVLRDDGTLWLNIGDSYSGSGRGLDADGTWNPGKGGAKQQTHRNNQNQMRKVNENSLSKNLIEEGAIGNAWVKPPQGLKAKDLVGIPWMLAFALRADGWYLRQDIIWNKPNPMPESVTDRCTKSHEYIFLLSKSKKYFYDHEAIKEDSVEENWESRLDRESKKSFPDEKKNGIRTSGNKNHKYVTEYNNSEGELHRTKEGLLSISETAYAKRNKRSVWTITTQSFPEAHFATFPEEIPYTCILAGTSAHGCCGVCGAPWERVTEPSEEYAKRLGKSYHDHQDDLQQGNRQPIKEKNFSAEYVTKGWQPTCHCVIARSAATKQSPNHSDESGGLLRRENAHRNDGIVPAIVPSVVLDPFSGAGTTAMVARKLNRNFIAIDLNEKYIAMSERRLYDKLGMFK